MNGITGKLYIWYVKENKYLRVRIVKLLVILYLKYFRLSVFTTKSNGTIVLVSLIVTRNNSSTYITTESKYSWK